MRYFPGSDFLNLLFGVVVSLAINMLTTVALSTDRYSWQIVLSSLLFFLSSISIGALALIAGRARDEALASVGPTLTGRERRAEVEYELARRRGQLGALSGTAILFFISGATLLVLAYLT